MITAAGSSRRMGGGNKLLLPLRGKPLLQHAIEAFLCCPSLAGVAVTAPEGEEERYRELLSASLAQHCPGWVFAGGSERQHSIANALERLPADPEDAVAIHDGARPNLRPALLQRLLQGLSRWDGVLPMVAVKDTIKRVGPSGQVLETLERSELFAAQTPQCFRYGAILAAHRRAREDAWLTTDDAALIEREGGKVGMVEGDYANLKITTAEDLALLEHLGALA